MKTPTVGMIRKAVEKMKKLNVKPNTDGNYLFPIDYRSTPTGRENWEVCSRMLIHDLLEMDIPEVKTLLKFYSITGTPWGTYTMALPRFNIVNPKVKK